jgi:hypothetical protein
MSPPPENGYSYRVSDQQLRTFASLSIERRLRWLEKLREVTFRLAPPHVRARWDRLRRGT